MNESDIRSSSQNTADDLASGSGHRPVHSLVVGLGNPILGDDGIGWRIAEQVERRLPNHSSFCNHTIDVICLAVGGLSLMEHLTGYDRAVIIDSIQTGNAPPGEIYTFTVEALPDYAYHHLTAAHDTSLQTALAVGRTMGVPLPKQVWIVAVEARLMHEFTEEITPQVAATIPAAVQQVFRILAA